jgi:hypothetical protein
VQVDVLLDARARGATEVPAEVVTLRRVFRAERVHAGGSEAVYLERLGVGQGAEIAGVAQGRNEQVTLGVRELVQEHTRELAVVHEERRLGVTEDAAVELVGLLHVLEAPGRPQRFRHGATASA